MTQTQFAALASLYQTGPCSQSELSKALALDTATVNGVVDRLTSRGFIVSRDDPNDRRRQIVSLTPAGAAIGPAAIDAARAITAGTIAKLTRAEEARLLHLLRKMIGRTGAASHNGHAPVTTRQRRGEAKQDNGRRLGKTRSPAIAGHGEADAERSG